MTLIIAEKPSLARNIAAALGNGAKGDGFLAVKGESGEYLVTWAFGHLFGLADVEAYNPNPDPKGRWTMANLPCFPRTYRYELRRENGGPRSSASHASRASQTKQGRASDGVERQFGIIRSLCMRQDVDTIVNAGDSDREGEIIVRLCILRSFYSDDRSHGPMSVPGKRLCRLWLPDQTPETIRAAVKELRDESEFDRLAAEGFARTFIDWLYGVNLTRFATLKSGRFLRVGRVIVPIVKAIYDRDLAIRNFVPEKYYSIASKEKTKGQVVELVSKLKFDGKDHDAEAARAAAKCAEYNALGAVVTDAKKKKERLFPGKLYSLTKLQNFLGKKYKMSMTQSLEIVQGLYEKGFVTYPRTNSEYLATAEKDKVKKVIAAVGAVGYPVVFKDSKSIFDDSKIESHSALTPTTKIPKKEQLSPDEAKVYGAIVRRFTAVFCAKDCVVERTEIKIKVGDPPRTGEEFVLKGMVILEPGWTKYDDYSGKDKVLPPLAVGDAVTIDFKPLEKETTPPKHYTIETLNNYLKNPFREELAKADETPKEGEEDDSEDYRAVFEGLELGTEATRTPIIDNARQSGYIELKKDVYTILPEGEALIESLARMKIGMDKYKTAELGKALKKVYRGEYSVTDSTALAEREITEVFAQAGSESDDGFFGDEVGKCPLCGGEVTRTKFGYGCRRFREGCKFSVSGVILGQTISLANVKKLLGEGQTDVIEGFLSKKGTRFSARLRLENGKAVFDFNGAPKREPNGLIPGLPVDERFR